MHGLILITDMELHSIFGEEVYHPCKVPNTLRPRQNWSNFADHIFKYIFWNENLRILLKISLEFVPKFRVNNSSALVQIMAWHRLSVKPLSSSALVQIMAWRRLSVKPLPEPMMGCLLTHICVTRSQCVNSDLCIKEISEQLHPSIRIRYTVKSVI